MASLPPSLRSTLAYFAKYDYPLTASELWFWQHGSSFSKLKIKKLIEKLEIGNWKLRKQREVYSQKKWLIAKRVGNQLKLFPTISAVFVTGALAMNNCPPDDDIDLMIVTSPNTLWITRFFVNIFLWSTRRFPGQTSAPNKICPNLWLDTNHLHITPHDIYRAHEILQAKVLWDHAGIHGQFLRSNSWVKSYLPMAYQETIKNLKFKIYNLLAKRDKVVSNFKLQILNLVNTFFFIVQYLYMLPKMTSERIGLSFAFFHPSKTSPS